MYLWILPSRTWKLLDSIDAHVYIMDILNGCFVNIIISNDYYVLWNPALLDKSIIIIIIIV